MQNWMQYGIWSNSKTGLFDNIGTNVHSSHDKYLIMKEENVMSKNEKRKLGASGIVVPPIGVGTMSWGFKQTGYGKAYSREDIMQAYHACLDSGLNYFDTAEGYEAGESERLIGECYRKDDRPIVISSKFDNSTIVVPSPSHSSPCSIMKALDGSLQRLGAQCIDLYQLHYPVPSKL